MAIYRRQLEDKDGNIIIPAMTDVLYPIGSIYLSATLSTAEQVAALFGGTWQAWGTGRIPVGVDTTQTEFNTVEKTGGSKTNTHQHYQTMSFDGASFYATQIPTRSRTKVATRVNMGGSIATANTREDSTYNEEISILQPYITCYMYKRIT